MDKYYYLVASLPYLRFKEEASITIEEFIEECRKWLSRTDMGILMSVKMPCYKKNPEDTSLNLEWKEFDTHMRKQLAEVRTRGKGIEEHKVPESLKTVIEQENPFLMETELERTRWSYIEEKQGLYRFDINWLVLYFLKLQILERISIFNKDKGEKIFYELCEVENEYTNG